MIEFSDAFLDFLKRYLFDCVAFVACFVALSILSKLKSYAQYPILKNNFDNTAWCVNDINHLRDALLCLQCGSRSEYEYPHMQNVKAIDEKYRIISDEEKEVLDYILNAYKEWLIKDYFERVVPDSRSKELSAQEFFAVSLFRFMDSKSEYSILYKGHFDDKKAHIVFLKLEYILYENCSSDKYMREHFGFFRYIADQVKNEVDTYIDTYEALKENNIDIEELH